VGGGSFEKDGSGWDTVVTGGTRLGDALRSSWKRLQGRAKATTTGNYEGLLVEPATTGALGRQLQSALTKAEVELAKHGELMVAELVKLHQHNRRRESHRAVFQSLASVWATAWPSYANVQDEQQPAGCACCMAHTWGCRWGSFIQ
jgi:hypothetical protein